MSKKVSKKNELRLKVYLEKINKKESQKKEDKNNTGDVKNKNQP